MSEFNSAALRGIRDLIAGNPYRPGAQPCEANADTLASDTHGDSYGAQNLAQAVLDGDITTDDLIYAGNVMDRYTRLLNAAGRSY